MALWVLLRLAIKTKVCLFFLILSFIENTLFFLTKAKEN